MALNYNCTLSDFITIDMENNNYIIENGIIAGNIYNKYESHNHLVRYMMKGFYDSLWDLISITGVDSIHEVGCGEGYLAFTLAQSGMKVHASDASAQIIDKAKAAFSEQNKGVNITFKVANIYELESDNDSDSLIVCSEVLEHLEHPDRAIKNLKKIANSYVLLSVPREPVWRLLNIIRFKYLRNLGNTPGHIQHWSRENFLKLLKDNGLKIIKVHCPLPWIMVLCRI